VGENSGSSFYPHPISFVSLLYPWPRIGQGLRADPIWKKVFFLDAQLALSQASNAFSPQAER